jgi:ADP-ribose pyrophosphatase
MPYDRKLPNLPDIQISSVEDISPSMDDGFLRLHRNRIVVHYPDGVASADVPYDWVKRPALDAAVMAAHFLREGERHVYLRSAVRPPIALQAKLTRASGLWELPAGLIEPTDQDAEGPRRTAQRELLEELGFDVALEALHDLGPPTYPNPGMIAETHYAFEVEVEPGLRGEPTCDGSPFEAGGVVAALPLRVALDACVRGELPDSKTELFLRRLADRVGL